VRPAIVYAGGRVCQSRKSRRRRVPYPGASVDTLLAAEISEGAEVGEDQRDAKLIFVAHCAQVNAAIFDGQAATAAIVADLDELVLQSAAVNVVADASGNVEAFAGDVAVAEHGADLLGERLDDGVALQAEVRDGEKEFAVGLELQEGADGGELLELRVVLEDLLGVVVPAGSEFEVADDGRPVARGGGEGEGGDGVQGLEDIALAGDQCAAESGIKIMFLYDAPGKEIDGLLVARFDVEMLHEAVFDFVGVGESGVAVKADEVGEVVDPGDVAIGREGFDRVLIAVMGARPVEKSLESGGAKLQREFAGVAGDGLAGKVRLRIERVAVVGGAKRCRSGKSEQFAEMEGDGDLGRKFRAGDKIRCVEKLIFAMNRPGEGIEGEIDW